MDSNVDTPTLGERLERVEVQAVAADRLVKALITLLSIDNGELLDNLEIVFEMASRQSNSLPPRSWQLIRKELNIIRSVVEEQGKLH